MMTVKENEKVGLKLNIQTTKIMATGPITSWQIGGGNSGNSVRLNFLGTPKSLKMVLAAMKLVIRKLDSILKSRDITLPTKVHLVKAVVFSSGHVWM